MAWPMFIWKIDFLLISLIFYFLILIIAGRTFQMMEIIIYRGSSSFWFLFCIADNIVPNLLIVLLIYLQCFFDHKIIFILNEIKIFVMSSTSKGFLRCFEDAFSFFIIAQLFFLKSFKWINFRHLPILLCLCFTKIKEFR